MAQYLRERWGFELEIPSGQMLSRGHRTLTLQPSIATEWAEQLPSFVRAGMRVSSLHKERMYLSQQTVGLWGAQFTQRRVELDWPQVQALFADNEVGLKQPSSLRGEVVCSYGPWQVCRGLVVEDGHRLIGYVPRGLRHAQLERLLPDA
ncbi:MAG: hypothetical protein HN712_01670 [Gemmatimonadetes bacterium]|nr:hypothetical protein [Gemmatimonadota bacterium]